MQREKTERREAKRPYAKPALRPIELATEEVLALGCKMTSVGFSVNVTPCVTFNQCNLAGS